MTAALLCSALLENLRVGLRESRDDVVEVLEKTRKLAEDDVLKCWA